MLLVGRAAASVLLDRLVRVRTSPTVLFWLRIRAPTLKTLKLGGALLRLCEELHVDVWNLGDDFFRAVRDEAARTVTVAPRCDSHLGKAHALPCQLFALVLVGFAFG